MKWDEIDFPIPKEEEWRVAVEKSLRGKKIEDYVGETYENITLKPLYTKKDRANVEIWNKVNSKDVVIYQGIIGKSVTEINGNIKNAIKNGQEVLHIPLDSLTKRGVDCDEGKEEDIFKGGNSINTLEDMKGILENISLDKYPLFMETGEAFAPFLALLKVYSQENNVQSVQGVVGGDPLYSLAANGTLTKELHVLFDEMAEGVRWGMEHTPLLKTILVNSDVYHNGGANGIQELACALGTGVEYIHECLQRGLHIDEVAPRMVFSFSVGNHFFMEIAKLRALRVLWAKVISAFGGNEASQVMYLHANTSQRTKTRYDEHVNLLRATTEGFAAIVGGVDSLNVSTYDEANGGGSIQAERLARNITHILVQESHLTKVQDPANGSYYVEALTKELMEKSWIHFQEIEKRGGMSKALQTGYIQEEIKKVANKRAERILNGKQKIIGTNIYRKEEELQEILMHHDEKCKRIQTLVRYKEAKGYEVSLDKKGDLIDILGEQVIAGATIGQLHGTEKNGHIKIEAIKPMRDGEIVEREVAEKREVAK